MKDRTNEEGIDPATDKPTDNARRRGGTESRCDGKHVGVQEQASACSFYAGLSRVRAEPPCKNPYPLWCGTRGWL